MRNIFNKKFLYILYFTILVTIVVAVYFVDILKENQFKEIAKELDKKLAITRVHMDISAFEHKSYKQLKAYADEIKKSTGLRTTLIDKQGFVLADSDVPLDKLGDVENHLLREEVQEALRTGTGLTIRRSATIGKRLLYYCETVKKNGRVIGFVRVAMFAPEIEAKMDFIRSIVWKLSIILFFSILIAGLILVIMYNRSQSSVYKDITKISDSDNFQPLSDQGREEFHQLISSINRMGNSLQQKLTKSEEQTRRLNLLYDFFDEGIAIFDENGHVLFYNHAFNRILQISERISYDKPFYYWLHFPPLVQDMESVQNLSEKFSRRTKFYGQTYIEYELIPLDESSKEINAKFVLKVKDISIIQRLEQIRQDFVTNASHELNTPLTSISGYLETLLSGTVKDKKKEKEFLRRIKKQTTLLENLVRDINDLSKSDNRLINSKEKFLLKRFLMNIHTKYEKKLKDSDLTFISEFDEIPDELEISSFKNYLNSAISNLLDNAIQYNNPGGKIYLRASVPKKIVHIEVEDTGLGIHDSEKDRIFELFYRTEDARDIYTEGTGLGLTIVQNFVQRMSGKIGIESSVGKGTTIWFEFPIQLS
jgi:two-component system, OmpR family, phosphate regulon sensor histidine kinase PhoR